MSQNLYFRPHTWDANIWRSVTEENEYQLSGALGADDCILDIGAHIGAFTYRTLDMGAGRVIAVEPDPGNFEVLRHNLHSACLATDRAILIPAAAVAPRNYRPVRHLYAAPHGTNTGGTTTLGDNGIPVAALPFDALLTLAMSWNGKPLRLLKLDCEGGEWPILERGPFEQINAVVGEYHQVLEPDRFPVLDLEGPRDRAWLVATLRKRDYRVSSHPTSEHLGLFWAWRDGWDLWSRPEDA